MKQFITVSVVVLFLSGCTTFGSFPKLQKGESSPEDVRSMLGEPVSKKFEGEQEIWKYRFTKQEDKKIRDKRTNLDLEINFENNTVENYSLSVSQEKVQEAPKPDVRQEGPRQQQPQQGPPRQGGTDAKDFIRQFDKDGDGRVSREEFPGPSSVFDNFDRNRDGFLDESEAPPLPQRGSQGQRPGGRRR